MKHWPYLVFLVLIWLWGFSFGIDTTLATLRVDWRTDDMTWQLVPPRTYIKFDNVGDSVEGQVVFYSPNIGETHRDNQTPCGFLDLDGAGGKRFRISLDKLSLTTQVSFALPEPGDVLRVLYAEDVVGKGGNTYHRFEVYRADSSDGQHEQAPLEHKQAGDKSFDKNKFDSQVADFKAALGTVLFDKVLKRLRVNDLDAIKTRAEAGSIYKALFAEVNKLKGE